jgi:hypothetical protein
LSYILTESYRTRDGINVVKEEWNSTLGIIQNNTNIARMKIVYLFLFNVGLIIVTPYTLKETTASGTEACIK